MKKKSCHGISTCDPQHNLPKSTEEAVKHQQGNDAKKSWKRYLTFLSKFQSKMKRRRPDSKAAANGGFRQKNPNRGGRGSLLSGAMVLEECSNLVHVVRRTAADCFAAAAAAATSGVDEDDLRYVQLDQVAYGVKRDAFGPVYLVT